MWILFGARNGRYSPVVKVKAIFGATVIGNVYCGQLSTDYKPKLKHSKGREKQTHDAQDIKIKVDVSYRAWHAILDTNAMEKPDSSEPLCACGGCSRVQTSHN